VENESQTLIGRTRFWIICGALVGIWALIGLQRFAPGFVAPFVIAEFSLTNTQWGIATGALAFSWAIGALFAGAIADRFGAKRTLIVAGLCSAMFGWMIGLVQSLGQLISARVLLGAAEGAIWPAVTSVATGIVKPENRGRIVSILIAGFLIVGAVIGAPLVTELGQSVGWRWAFAVVSLPLFILVGLVWWWLPRDGDRSGAAARGDKAARGWGALLSNRNLLLASLIAVCMISRIFIITAFGALYLTGEHGIDLGTAGAMLGASLAGDVVGTLLFGWIADRTGHRKWLVVVLSALAAGCGAVFATLPVGTDVSTLVGMLFLFTLFSGGVIPLMLVVIPSEAAPVGKTASAIGLVNFSGEFFGAGLFPIVGGLLGDLLGLRYTLLLGAVLVGFAALLGLALVDQRGPVTGSASH